MVGNTTGGDPFPNYFKKEIIVALRAVLNKKQETIMSLRNISKTHKKNKQAGLPS